MRRDVTLAILAFAIIGYLVYTGGIKINLGTATTSNSGSSTTIVYQQAPTGAPLIKELAIAVQDAYTQKPVEGIQVQFYLKGTDVRSPNALPKYVVTTDAEGRAVLNDIINAQTFPEQYDIYINGSDTYYDEKIQSGTWSISYNLQGGYGELVYNGKTYIPVTQVGKFYDITQIPEASSDINTSYAPGTIAYITSVGNGVATFQIDIGNQKLDSELRDVVMCFMDRDGDMDGDELTSLTVTPIFPGEGEIHIESNLLGYWQEGMGSAGKSCFKIADVIKGGDKARIEFNLGIDESKFTVGKEFEIAVDDLGDYGAKQYPSRSVKATPSVLTFTVQ